MAYISRYEKRGRLAFALYACPVVALFIWYLSSSQGPAKLLLSCYVLVATPFFVLTGSYPPFGSRWFWKAMVPIAAIASLGVYVQVQLTEWFRYIDVTLPSRTTFGFTSAFAMLEGLAAFRIVTATAPKTNSQ